MATLTIIETATGNVACTLRNVSENMVEHLTDILLRHMEQGKYVIQVDVS